MSDKDKDKDKDEKSKDENAGAKSVDLRRRQPADLARRFIASLTGRERREIMDQLTGELMTKRGWRHPIGAVAFSDYHRCAACNGEFSDEVVMVTERLRTGDRHYVFCNTTCLMNYDGWL